MPESSGGPVPTVWGLDVALYPLVSVLRPNGFVDFTAVIDMRAHEWDIVHEAELEVALSLVDPSEDVRFGVIYVSWIGGNGSSTVELVPEVLAGGSVLFRIPSVEAICHQLEDEVGNRIQQTVRIAWNGTVPVQVFLGWARLRVETAARVWDSVPDPLRSSPHRAGVAPVGLGYASPRLTNPFALFLEQSVQTMRWIDWNVEESSQRSRGVVDGAPAGEMTGRNGWRFVEVLRSVVGGLLRWRASLPW